MDVKTLQDLLIKILRSELTETELEDSVKEQLTPDVLSALYSLAACHDLAHVVFSALYRCGWKKDGAIPAQFHQKAILAVYRNEQMKYAYDQICDAFDQAAIPYIPLKGSVIRPFYPQESMRTSCDIDILVREENLETAVEALVSKGFRRGERHYHDVSLFSQANVHLELHFSIQENIDRLDAVLKEAWQYAKRADGSRYQFTDAFFVFHMFAHMSYHFLSGGCGLKSLMDLWVMAHRMGLTYECAGDLLERGGIYRFSSEISKIAEICFSGKPGDAFSEDILSYLCSGGAYGTFQNRIAVQKAETKRTAAYAMRRLFPPYKNMTILYPVLCRLPFLLPFCWIARFCNMLFGGKVRRTMRELKTVSHISEDKTKHMVRMREYLGLWF